MDDLDAIWDYIAADDPDAAARWLHRVRDRFLMLARQPLIGEPRDELLPRLRSFPLGSYVIFYRALPETDVAVEVVRVVHGARDVRRLF